MIADRRTRRAIDRRVINSKRRGFMTVINYTSEFKTATGTDFIVASHDAGRKKVAIEKIKEDAKLSGMPFILDPNDMPFDTLDFGGVVIWLLNDIIPDMADPDDDKKLLKLGPEYSGNAYHVIKAFRYAMNDKLNTVEIETGIYVWMINIVTEHGFRPLKVMQAVLLERLKDEVKLAIVSNNGKEKAAKV